MFSENSNAILPFHEWERVEKLLWQIKQIIIIIIIIIIGI